MRKLLVVMILLTAVTSLAAAATSNRFQEQMPGHTASGCDFTICAHPLSYHFGCGDFTPEPLAGNDSCFVIDASGDDDGPFLDVFLPVSGCSQTDYPMAFYLGRVLGDIGKLEGANLLNRTAEVTICFANGLNSAFVGDHHAQSAQFNINGRFSGRFAPLEVELPELGDPPPDFHLYQVRWQKKTFEVPVEAFNWPSAPGAPAIPGHPDGTVVPSRNVLTVSTAGEGVTMVDWMVIKIHCADPVLLVHGWNGKAASTWGPEWDTFLNGENGLPYDAQMELGSAKPLLDNLAHINAELQTMKAAYGTDHVTLIGHSKGALASRAFAAAHPDIVRSVAMLSTPHLGTQLVNVTIGELKESARVKANLAFWKLVLGALGALDIGYWELSPWSLTAARAAYEYSPDVKYESVAGVWDWKHPELATGGLSQRMAVRALSVFGPVLAHLSAADQLNDGVVSKRSALGFPYGGRDSVEGDGTPIYSHVMLAHQRDVQENFLAPQSLRSPFARIPGRTNVDSSATPFAQLETKSALIVGATASYDSVYCGDTGQVSCVVYTTDSTSQVAVRFPGIGWVDSSAAAGDSSLVFGRAEIFGSNAVLVGANCLSAGELAYKVQRPTAAATDTAAFGAAAFVTGANDWIRMGVNATSIVQDSSVIVSLESNGTGGCTSCADTVTALAPNGDIADIAMRDDGGYPDNIAGDGIAHGLSAALTQPGGYVFVGRRVCRTGGGGLCRVTTGAVSCGVRQLASIRAGSSQVLFNGVGQYSTLIGVLPIDMDHAGHVLAFATLYKDTTIVARATLDTTLSAGEQSVQLRFPGSKIYAAGLDGPYVIRGQAEVQSDSVGIDVAMADVTTPAHQYFQFEHDLIRIVGPLSWHGIDANGNGRYDTLAVQVPIALDQVSGTFGLTGVLRDSLGNGFPCLFGSADLPDTATAVTLKWLGSAVGNSGVFGTLTVADFGLTSGAQDCVRDVLGTLSGVRASDFEGFVADSMRVQAVHSVAVLCPIGDADSLQLRVKLPIALGASARVEDHVVYAVRVGTTGGPVTLWRTDSTGTTGSDTLKVTSFNDADTTAVLGWARGSGCGTTTWQCFLDSGAVGSAVGVSVRSYDASSQAIGAVDRFDTAALVGAQGHDTGGCWDLNASGGLVDSVDAGALVAHLGHHLPRRYFTPTGPATYALGDSVRILWRKGFGDSACVTVRAVRGASTDTIGIVADRPDSGSYLWVVPSTMRAAGDYKLQVLFSAGRYAVDHRDLGLVASDTTIAVRPKPVADASTTRGRHSWTLDWDEPTQNGGIEADEYKVRFSEAAITESNFDAATVEAPDGTPGPGDTPHCVESQTSMPTGHTYYFAIRTRVGSVWSKLSNQPTAGTGGPANHEVFCELGDLMAGGGGGGDDLLRSRPRLTARANAGITSLNDDVPEVSENSLLGWAGDDYTLDTYKLPSEGVLGDAGYAVRLRQLGSRPAYLDRVGLGYVDRSSEAESYVAGSTVLIGHSTPASAAWYDGANATGTFATASVDSPFVGAPGRILQVELGGLGAGQALIVAASGPAAQAVGDTSGILVEVPSGSSSWTVAGHVHPRRQLDEVAVPVLLSSEARLVFYGDYQVSGLRKLTIGSQVTPTPLSMTSAVHSRIGDVKDAESADGGDATTLQMGDTLSLSYATAAASEGTTRDLFLSARGRFGAATPPDSLQSADAAVVVASVWQFSLGRARPNPSASDFTIDYSLARDAPVTIRVYDVAGRLVRTLVNGTLPAGPHTIVWDGRNQDGRRVASSVYFYRMVAGSFTSQRKAVLLTH